MDKITAAEAGESPLPQFTVRHLRDPDAATSTTQPIQASQGQDGALEKPGVFKMRKGSYDNLVNKHPKAALTYYDSDNDRITVSSFPLSASLDHRESPELLICS